MVTDGNREPAVHISDHFNARNCTSYRKMTKGKEPESKEEGAAKNACYPLYNKRVSDDILTKYHSILRIDGPTVDN